MTVLISVIVPVFNGETYLAAALQSIRRQDAADLQLIVVDDGSTDGTADLLASYGRDVTVIRQSNLGPAAARNAGLDHATGQFIAFNDADDLWTAGRVAWQLDYLQSDETAAIVQGQMQYLHDDGATHGKPFFALSLVTGLFRREVFERVGRLDESLRYCEDVEWFFRAQRLGVKTVREEQIVLHYRRHAHNATNRMDLVRQATLRVVQKHRKAMQT